ncbi:MAG: SGNH/GDSL hydrolase family protein [Verrucomicrobia bacterium]|nr:SGNH/GDSL hydrolase family protein [Verrucomicrobiota bacterium]
MAVYRARLTGQRKILVLADSHGQVFEYIAAGRLVSNTYWDVCIVQGATARGVSNPNSRTQTQRIFKRHVQRRPFDYDVIIVQLGEVDCGFLMWHRWEHGGQPLTKQLEETVQRYGQFVAWVEAQAAGRRLILAGAILPTIRDGQAHGQVANLRSAITATLAERTALTQAYNQRLQGLADTRGFAYVDINSAISDAEGTVRPELLQDARVDHHLSSARTAPLWIEVLRPYLACVDPGTVCR